MKPADFIRHIWSLRREKNASYSLTAFARDLKVSQPYLSKILSGKRSLTPKRAYFIGKSLNLNDSQLLRFIEATLGIVDKT